MEVLILLVFVSMTLAALAVGFFAWNVRTRNHEHTERLAILPLNDDEGPSGFDEDDNDGN